MPPPPSPADQTTPLRPLLLPIPPCPPCPRQEAPENQARTPCGVSSRAEATTNARWGRNGPATCFTRDLSRLPTKADGAHYDALLHGSIAQSCRLDALIPALLDRPMAEVFTIEHAVLWIGTYELQHCLDVPLRVVINECD